MEHNCWWLLLPSWHSLVVNFKTDTQMTFQWRPLILLSAAQFGWIGNWTTGCSNLRIANSRTGHFADWTTRGLADAAERTKSKHAKSPVASAICLVRDMSSPRVIQSASWQSASWCIRELSSNLCDCDCVCIFFHICWISAEIWIFNFPR